MKEVIVIIGLIGATLIIRHDLTTQQPDPKRLEVADFVTWYVQNGGK